MMEWYRIEDKMPEVGAHILAQLYGCKIATYCEMIIREGEGLGHISRWKYYEIDGDNKGQDYGNENNR